MESLTWSLSQKQHYRRLGYTTNLPKPNQGLITIVVVGVAGTVGLHEMQLWPDVVVAVNIYVLRFSNYSTTITTTEAFLHVSLLTRLSASPTSTSFASSSSFFSCLSAGRPPACCMHSSCTRLVGVLLPPLSSESPTKAVPGAKVWSCIPFLANVKPINP